MNLFKTSMSIAALGLVGIAVADDSQHVEIAVIENQGDHDPITIQLDSDDLGFNLHDMQEGENQAFVDKEGRTVLVTRTADGFSFNVDGKTVDVPMLSGDHHGMVMVQGDQTANIDFEVIHEVIEDEIAHDGAHEVRIVKKVEVVAD